MKKLKRLLTAFLTAAVTVSTVPAFSATVNAATILSDCTEAGYYMASPENNVRSTIGGESLGHLDSVQVYRLDCNKFIKDEDTGLTWIKLKNATLKETGEKADGYICLSYCYYMGTYANCKKYEVASATPAQESFYADSGIIDILEEGETVYLLDTGDAQLYSPQKRYWVNVCDLREPLSDEYGYYNSLYTDYSGLDYSCNENAFFNENQRIIYLHFIEQGYPETSACAIAVNAYDESGCDPTAWCTDTNGLISYGLFQWNGGRNARLKEWCAGYNYDYTDIYAQLAYLDWELENYYPYVRDTLLDYTISAGEASYCWASQFEVCASRYWNGRVAEAESLYNSLISNRAAEAETYIEDCPVETVEEEYIAEEIIPFEEVPAE